MIHFRLCPVRKSALLLIIFILFFSFSIRVRAQDAEGSISTFYSLGIGRATKVELNDEHCGFLPEGCRAKVSGDWRKLDFGRGQFSAELDTAWQTSTPNGWGGYCAPLTGTAVVQLADKDGQVFMAIKGRACDVLFSSERLPHEYTSQFTVTGGTGAYEHAEGGGELKAIDYGRDRVFFSANGTIRMP